MQKSQASHEQASSDQVMNNLRLLSHKQLMKIHKYIKIKLLISQDYLVMSKSLGSSEQVMRKSRTSHEQI